MRKCFFVGLMALLPVIVTYVVIVFGIGLVTSPFEHLVRYILENIHLFEDGFGIFTHKQMIFYLSKLLIICFLALFIFLVGFFAARLVFHSWGYYIDHILRKIPVIRKVYGPSKELVDALFKPRADTPRQAVLVPYPSSSQQAVGIVTGEFVAKLYEHEESYLSVFVPATPNATSGYLCIFPKASATLIDLTADEALKYVMGFASINTIAIKE